MSSMVASIVTGLVIGMAAWFGANFIGKPVLALRNKRLEAFQIAERYSSVNFRSGDDLRRTAITRLHDVGNALLAFNRESSLVTRAYCRWCKYDLLLAAQCLFGLAEGPRGEYVMNPEQRKNTVNAIYYSLGAKKHLSPEEIAAVEQAIESTKGVSGT